MAKVTKTASAGRMPMRWSRIGALRFSRTGAARNSLRSDTRAFLPRSAAMLGMLSRLGHVNGERLRASLQKQSHGDTALLCENQPGTVFPGVGISHGRWLAAMAAMAAGE